MYFSSQGAAKVLGPVLAQTARLLFIAVGGWWLSVHHATAAGFFALAAASMVVLGVLSTSSVVLTRWGPKERSGPRHGSGAILTSGTREDRSGLQSGARASTPFASHSAA